MRTSVVIPEARLVVVQHETGIYLELVRMWKHALYDPDNILSTPDVGIIEVAGFLPTSLPLADFDVLRDLSVLEELSLCGFPGDVSRIGEYLESSRPRVTCLSGSLSALRPFYPGDAATDRNTFLIQHDIQTSGGTSGSAIFDALGRVVAIHNASTQDTTASNRFAMRIDLVACHCVALFR